MASERNSIQEAVYEELRIGILNLTLKPGSGMSTQDIANRLNVSRTPVREAFIRLQREGLVIAHPQRETEVAKIDLHRMEQERFIRECLELGVIDPFLNKCSKQDLNRIEEQIAEQKKCRDRQDQWGFMCSDDYMHRILFRVSGLELAWSTINITNGHYNRLRFLTLQTPEIMDEAIRQHETWLALLRADDAQGAKKELTDHVRKINYEKIELVEKYGDYFEDEIKVRPAYYSIGSLRTD